MKRISVSMVNLLFVDFSARLCLLNCFTIMAEFNSLFKSNSTVYAFSNIKVAGYFISANLFLYDYQFVC